MRSASIQDHALLRDEPAPLSSKPAEVKAIEGTTIGLNAARKEIDAAIAVMHDQTKALLSRLIDERSALKAMRHERTGETGTTFGFLSDPTCFIARGNEVSAGLDSFQVDPMSIADAEKSFTAWRRGVASEATCCTRATRGRSSPRERPAGVPGPDDFGKNPRAREERWLPWSLAWIDPIVGPPPRVRRILVTQSKSSTTDAPSEAPARSSRGTRQSYLLLAVGIVVAIALPYLLQPRAGAFSAASATAMSSHPMPTSSP